MVVVTQSLGVVDVTVEGTDLVVLTGFVGLLVEGLMVGRVV